MKRAARKEHLEDIPLEIRAEMALKEAVTETLAEHKRRGFPVAVWRDGRAVWVPPEEIVIPGEA